MPRWHRSPQVLSFAREWRDRCFQADGSILTRKRLWTSENLRVLLSEYHRNFDRGRGDPFLLRLKQQLRLAPAAVQQLAAEVLWILYLGVSEKAAKGTTKRQQIREIWDLSGEPFPAQNPALGAVLETGVGNPNPGFARNSWKEFVFCVEVASAWKTLTARDRGRLLKDPWFLADWLDRQPDAPRRQFRHLLLYMLYPEHFERVLARRHKQRIVESFYPRFGLNPLRPHRASPTALDRALYDLRPLLEEYYQSEIIDYYRPPVGDDWDRDRPGRTGGTSGPSSVGVPATDASASAAASQVWNDLADLALEGRWTTIEELVERYGFTKALVVSALHEISDFCRSEDLPQLVILALGPPPLRSLPGFQHLTQPGLAEAREAIAEFRWHAYGNPFAFAEAGAGQGELAARLVADPDSAGDVFRLVRHRGRAQRVFREALLRTYGGRCAFSGSRIREGLEAAHLVPWNYASHSERMDVRNGLLPTSWHHRLFDAGLLQLDDQLRIHVHPRLLEEGAEHDRETLARLDGKPMRLPKVREHRPDARLVRARRQGISLEDALPQ